MVDPVGPVWPAAAQNVFWQYTPSNRLNLPLAGAGTVIGVQALPFQLTAAALREITGDVPPAWFGERGADAYVAQLLDRAPLVLEVIRK